MGGLSVPGVAAGVSEEILLARAYLSRVAEPTCIPLWGLVRDRGPVAAVACIRSADVPDDLLPRVAARRFTVEPAADLDAAQRCGMRLLVPEAPDWPHFALGCLERTGEKRLAEWRAGTRKHDINGERVPPLALWVRGPGDPSALAVRSVSVVGARASSPYGNQVAGDLAYGLSSRGFTVVSGGAYGIDAAAHRGALAASGETVLVSAGGLDRAYPPAHEALYRRTAEAGLLVSESPPGSAPQRQRFLTRNRLISAFGTGTVIVESARRSGARNTAAHCEHLGRPLMVVPGPVTSATSVGNHDLLRAGSGQLVTSVADVVSHIGSIGEDLQVASETPDPVRPTLTEATTRADRAAALRTLLDGLDDGARRVYDGLPTRGPVSVTGLVQTSGLPTAQVLAALPVLVLQGLVEDTGEGVRRCRT